MVSNEVAQLEWRAGLENAISVVFETRRYLSTPAGLCLAAQLGNHLAAYGATDDLIPFFGDHRLAHTEACFQLKNSVCLAYHGFYSQAFSTLRSVCELSLLQASLPDGTGVSGQKLDLLRLMLPSNCELPGLEEVNWVLPAGFGANQSPKKNASSIEEWAVDGCRTPPWRKMFDRLLESDCARRFASETKLFERLSESMRNLDPYVHARGWLRSATGLSRGNMLRFSEESLSQFGARFMCATQVSIAMLLLAFLPSAVFNTDSAAGFIDSGDLIRALSVLPSNEATLLKGIYDSRSIKSGSI